MLGHSIILDSTPSKEWRLNINHVIKEKFKEEVLSEYTCAESPYALALKNTSDSNIETDITLLSNNVPMELEINLGCHQVYPWCISTPPQW